MAATHTPRKSWNLPGRRFFEEAGEMSGFGLGAMREVPGSFRYTAEIVRQFSILIRTSTFFIAALTFFIGFTQTTFSYYVIKQFGATDYAGAFTGIVVPRATGPFMFGYAFAAIVGCSLVAEIGAMRINEEIDGYEAEGVNPMRYIVGTRVVAAILYAPVVGGIAMLADGVGSWLNLTNVAARLNSSTFWHFHWQMQGIPELLFALATMTLIGVAITLVGCFYGFRARGGPAGVGSAVARSLVINLPLAQAIAGLMEFAFYGKDLNLGLPIGG